MNTNYLDCFDIELSNIWKYELELIYYNLKTSKKREYSVDDKNHLEVLYKATQDINTIYGKSFITKIGNIEGYLQFQKNYRTKKTLKDKIEFGMFDHKEEMYYLSQKVIIPKEDDFFDYWFALKLDQFDVAIKYIDDFLQYHLKNTFNNNHLEYYNFLTLTLRQYEDTLLTYKVVETTNDYLDFLLKKIKIKSFKKTSTKKRIPPLGSYVLIGSKSNPHFFQKNNSAFTQIFDLLKEEGFIHNDTSYTQFKTIFSGEAIHSNNRIHWMGQIVDLKAFVSILFQSHKIEKPNSGIWKLTSACFIDKNKREFNPTALRNSVPSEDTKRTFRKIAVKFP